MDTNAQNRTGGTQGTGVFKSMGTYGGGGGSRGVPMTG